MIFQSWKNKQNNVEEMHCKRASCSKWQQSTVSSTLDAPVYGWDVCIDLVFIRYLPSVYWQVRIDLLTAAFICYVQST